MTVRITLTDEELPPSGDFIAFLRQWISGAPFDGTSWARDGHARAIRAGTGASRQQVLRDVSALVESDEGSRHLTRAYELFVALLVGDSDALAAIHDRFRFILVVGIPRSGGKYLTKQLFRALGHDPNTVPEVLGHDAYPDAGPWRFGEGLGSVSRNGWTTSLQTTAEYLTMVELFFGAGAQRGHSVVVPSKATKAPYAAGLFRSAFGENTEAVVTVRHPVPACVSTYEACGGYPQDGHFAVRRNIERFCARELIDLGFTRSQISEMDYFDAYLRYWENYHSRLAMSVARISPTHTVVAYGADAFVGHARRFATRFGAADCQIEPFAVKDPTLWRTDWLERAEQPMNRVAAQWARAGLEFPLDAVHAAW